MKKAKFNIIGTNPDDLIKEKDLGGMLFTIGDDVGAIYTGTPLIKYPNPPHKHRDLIIAWANGADIEVSSIGYNWVAKCRPTWDKGLIYRIKPAKTPKELKIAKLEAKLAKLKGEL